MKIKQTLENIARGLALTGVLTFGGCSDVYKIRNLSKGEKAMYSAIYNPSKEQQKEIEKYMKPALEKFSAKREMYIKEAGGYPWMNPKNLTERDKFYIVIGHALGDMAVVGAGHIQAQGRAVSPSYKEPSKDSNSKKDTGF